MAAPLVAWPTEAHRDEMAMHGRRSVMLVTKLIQL